MRRMSNFGRQGLVAALEDDSNPTDVPQDTLGDNAESLETDLIEVAEDAADADESSAQVDEAVETAEALESLALSLESAAANGGLDQYGAQVLTGFVGHLYSRVGIRSNSVPALESFGGTGSRVQATTLALEEIKQKIAEIWKAIVEAIKKSIEWIKAQYMKIADAATKLETRAKALAARADSTNGTAKEKTIENERLANALRIGTEVKAPFATSIAAIKAVANDMFSASTEKSATTLAEVLEKGEIAGLATLTGNEPKSLTAISNPDADGFEKPEAGLQLERSVELPGGKAVVARTADDSAADEAVAENIGRWSVLVGEFKPNFKGTVKKELPTLAPSDAAKVAEGVVDIAVVVQKYKANISKISEIKKRIVAAADKVGRTAASETDAGKQKELKLMQKIATSTSALLDKPAASFSVYTLNTCKSALDYVELSLKQYA